MTYTWRKYGKNSREKTEEMKDADRRAEENSWRDRERDEEKSKEEKEEERITQPTKKLTTEGEEPIEEGEEKEKEEEIQEGKEGSEKEELNILQKAINIAFGNWLEKNPLTGEERIDPTTGEPIETRAGVVPITPAMGSLNAAKSSTGVITKTKEAVGIAKPSSITTQWSFVGKDGYSGVNKLFAAGSKFRRAKVAMNPKSITQSKNALTGKFSKEALAFFGTWAGSIFLGRWGQAEAGEAILIPLRDAKYQAEKTGDWTTYDKYLEAAKDITDPPAWKRIMLWSPLAAIPGIESKMRGVRKGIELMEEIGKEAGDVETAEQRQRTEEEEYYENIREEQEQKELEKMEWESRYYELIREGNYEAAEQMLNERRAA